MIRNDLKGISPFTDIQKEQLAYGGFMKSKAYGVKIKTNNIEKPWAEVGIVSSDYLLVPNKKIVTMAEEIMNKSDLNFEPEKQFWNGKQFFASWQCLDEFDAEVQVGDNLGLGLGVWNSYDGSTRAKMVLFAYRLVCTNGMTSRDEFSEYNFKHDIENVDWEYDMAKSMELINHAEENIVEFANKCSNLSKHYIRVKDLAEARKRQFETMGTSVFGKAMDNFLTNEKYETRTAWDLLNAGTDIFWHNKKQTTSDFNHNKLWVDGCLEIAA
jgi:hypothetical protein